MKHLLYAGKAVLYLLAFCGLFCVFFTYIAVIVFLFAGGLIAVPAGFAGVFGFGWAVSSIAPPAMLCGGLAAIALSGGLALTLYWTAPAAADWCSRMWDRLSALRQSAGS